ncbi:MAG: hypothetical protein IIB02_03285 [Thaumarchaeota archaeon]|nr:hypothetical protein [Nitrososphaerota archaeon]
MEEEELLLTTIQLYENVGKTIQTNTGNLKKKLDSSGELSFQDLEELLRQSELCLLSLDMIREKLSDYLTSRKDSI